MNITARKPIVSQLPTQTMDMTNIVPGDNVQNQNRNCKVGGSYRNSGYVDNLASRSVRQYVSPFVFESAKCSIGYIW